MHGGESSDGKDDSCNSYAKITRLHSQKSEQTHCRLKRKGCSPGSHRLQTQSFRKHLLSSYCSRLWTKKALGI